MISINIITLYPLPFIIHDYNIIIKPSVINKRLAVMDMSCKTKGQLIHKDVTKDNYLSEEMLKSEAVEFIGEEIKQMNKQTIARMLTELKKEHENARKRIQRSIQKAINGKGKGWCEPPEEFCCDILDTKRRKDKFATICIADINEHEIYFLWIN